MSRRPARAGCRGITRHSPSTIIYVARITAVELTCAVARRRKGKTLTPRRVSSILHRFGKHLDGRYIVVQVTPSLLDDAMRLGMLDVLCADDVAGELAAPLELCSSIELPRRCFWSFC